MEKGYFVLSTGRSDTAMCCEHCGRVIIRFAYIKSRTTARQYRVGLDCMKTLCKSGDENRQLSINF